MHGLKGITGEGNGNPLQYSCLENPLDRGAWWATVHGVAELDTTEQLTHTHTQRALCLVKQVRHRQILYVSLICGIKKIKQMNITKQKWTHRHTEQTSSYQWGQGRGEGQGRGRGLRYTN